MADFVFFADWEVRKLTVYYSLPSLCGQPLLLHCLPRLPPDTGCRSRRDCVAAGLLPAS